MLLVGSTGGRLLMAVGGLVVISVCLGQLRLAVQGGFADSLRTAALGDRIRSAARPGTSRDLDQLLDDLVRHPVGHALVWAMAVGFVVFALYSFLEVRYREVHAGD